MSHNYIYGSFSRLSDFPLDDRYLFETKELLNKYLTKTGKITTTAYEGQLVYVIEDEALYLIQKKDNGELYPQIITSERYDDADIRDEINNIKTALNNGKYHQIEKTGGIAFGIYTVARDYRFAVGEYNIDDKDALFIVGNGTEDKRNNAFTVNKEGTATVSSDPKKEMDVATKKYVDEKISNVDVDLTDYVTKDDLNNAVDGLIDTETLNNTVKDLATKDDIPDISGLATKDELQSAIADISVVSKEEFVGLSEKVESLDTDIAGLVDDLNDKLTVQNNAIVSLSDRVSIIENANPEIPENVVDEDRLTEALQSYTTKDDLSNAISKISTLNKKIIDSISGNKVIIDGIEKEPDSNTIYLLKDNSASGPDIYKEYTLIDNVLTLIGDTSTSLTGLATTEYVDSKVDSIDIPVNVSDLVNDTGYITDSYLEDYVRVDELPTKVSQLENDKNYINDLSNYYTKEEVDALIAEDNNGSGDVTIPIQPTITLDDAVSEASSNGVKSSGIYSFVKDEISKIEHPDIEVPSLDGYATEEWVGEQGYLTELPEHTHDQYLTEHQSLENYTTKTDLAEAISKIDTLNKKIIDSISGNKIVIDGVETEAKTNTIYLLKDISSSGPDIYKEYTLIDNVLTLIGDTSISLDEYAKKDDIPVNVSDLVNDAGYIITKDLELYVRDEDLENYATKTFVSEKIAEAQLADKEIDLSEYATKEDIKDLATESFVNDAISSIEIPDTSSFITMADVEEKGYITEHQSLEGYATEEWVGEQGYLTELPEHTHDQYLTEHQDISGKLDVSVYNTEKETFLTEDDISNVATKDELTPITNNIDSISKKVDSQQEVINKFFTGNAQEAYDELSEIGAAIVELRDQVIDENIAGALVDKVIDIEQTRYTKTEVDNLLENKANKEHSHEEYTTETEVNTLIDAKLGQVSIDSIDPSKVVFPEEIKTTYSIGKIIVSNNTPTTLIKAGDTLKDFFNIFVDETIGTVTQPSISNLSMSGNNAYYEVGYTLSKPKLSFTFNDGTYKYGPEPTGVTLTSIAATYNGVNKTLSDFTVSGNNYSITFDDVVISKEGNICNLTNLDIGYSAGSKPITNLGNESDTGAISAGTLANKHSGISSCKGYWPLFYKNVTETKNDDGTFDRLVITADNIRSKLTKSDLKTKASFSITIADGSTSVIITVPSSWGEIKGIKDVQANADVLDGFSISDLEINGYNENTKYKQTYKLYVFNSAGLGSTTYNVSF